jgi:hypothetical protein
VALLKPFLNSTLLFSSISPDFKSHLWDEIINCVNYVGIDHNTILSMPTYIRKIYIAKHNEKINEQNEKIKQKNRKNKK